MTEKTLFVEDWKFLKLSLDSSLAEAGKKESEFRKISLPHDWLIYDVNGLYEDSKGFYEKTFNIKKEADKKYEIYFEGVYMDSTVYLNDKKLGDWKYGYSSFFFDMTDVLRDGENKLMVEVRYQSPNTRWYSGAGIYRNVYLIEKDKNSFITDSLYISNTKTDEKNWNTKCIIECDGEILDTDIYKIEILDEAENVLAKKTVGNAKSISKEDNVTPTLETDINVTDPKLWSVDEPNLYTIALSWMRDGEILDYIETKIGYKDLFFDTNKGLFLNGKHIKLNGACEHHDFGALGSVFYKPALKRKFEMLKDMGVNAIRSTHNMPAVGLLELADEMGLLVIDEAFDMWERPKTTYDYARFFPKWYEKDIKSFVRRDRNHACLLMWSIGNEIYDTHASERGQEVTRMLKSAVEKHDYLGNAHATIGSNFMPWENARKCADILKFAGYNYGEKYYNEHHKEHPDWVMYGSETASTVQSRGIYHFPYKQSVLADDDEQCSSLGNSTTSWGADNAEYCIISERDAKFSLGQFIWTGFDYIGEPTPYHTKNSYFGQIDTAGFPKDNFYIFRAGWSDKNTTHIFPYWNWNKSQLIDVRVATNAPKVELFVNGKSQGLQEIDHENGKVLTGNWQVPYEEGEVTAVSYDANGNEIGRDTRHSFGDTFELRAKSYEEKIVYDRDAVCFISIEAFDKNGFIVENANNRVFATVKNGNILGMDNGDSTDEDEYKTNNKRLFNGKLLLMVAPDGKGDLEIELTSKGVKSTRITVPVVFHIERTVTSTRIPEVISNKVKEDDIWVREIELVTSDGQSFSKDIKEMDITAKVYPEEAIKYLKDEDIIWKAVNDSGIETSLARVESKGLKAHVKALGDGQFRIRCMVKNGCKQVKVMSSLELTVSDLGIAYLNPYKFIAGGLFNYSEGDCGNGNEHGVSTARDGRSVVGFENIDFGDFGSDEITIPIFELGGDPTPVQIWEGIPESKNSTLVADIVYHKPSIWNVYQPVTCKLSKRLKGISGIYFVLNTKIHIKGFEFTKQEKAFTRLNAAECDGVYGDEFRIEGSSINNIGNNVSIEFKNMDFGDKGAESITILGQTLNDKNSIHILFEGEASDSRREILEFTGKDKKEITFNFKKVTGKQKVTFVFLPGSKFDFDSFKFN